MPTRGRPWSALESIASIKKTASRPDDVLICVCQDADDTQTFRLTRGDSLDSIIAARKRFVEWCNYATNDYIMDFFTHIGWAADDVRFLTPGWDDLVQEHKELVVYGQDGIQNEKMATHPFIRTEIPRALGYLLPPELVHGCADTFIEALAREIGSIAYDPRIKTDHLHVDAGKSEDDQTYKDAREFWPNDLKTFETVIRPRIPDLAKQVTEFIKSHQ